jgi:YegS/Rv2252/BmrU family lipid kinase
MLIINPTAGRGRAGKRVDRIGELLDAADVSYQLFASSAVGDLEEQVKDQVDHGTERIIVAGGDGSIHEAVNGIMRARNNARLGVIPTGTGNDFAKACEIPLDWELATQMLGSRIRTDARWRRIDIGRMNDRYFANGAGIGFDAKVTKVARSYRWPIGDFVYLLAILRCLVDGVATPDMEIVADELSTTGPVTLANVSNGAWVGGMFHIAPMADNADGRLELVIADRVSRLRILSLLPKLVRGEHLGQAEVSHASVRSVTIEASEPVPSHLDGEVGELASRFEIEILPAALEML